MALESEKSLKQAFDQSDLDRIDDSSLVQKLISNLQGLSDLGAEMKLKVSFLEPQVNAFDSSDHNKLELERLAISREIFDRIEFAYEAHPKLHFSSIILQNNTNYPESLEWKEGKSAAEALAQFEKLDPGQLLNPIGSPKI
jgi:hypothetical protein